MAAKAILKKMRCMRLEATEIFMVPIQFQSFKTLPTCRYVGILRLHM